MRRIIELKENPDRIFDAKSIFNNIKKINIDYSQENFLVFFLNTKNVPLDVEVMFKGGLDACLIDPKTIFRKALLFNSSRIIVAHNHPSGDVSPSEEDIEVFNKLQEIGNMLGLDVLDSIVFNETSYYSMGQND